MKKLLLTATIICTMALTACGNSATNGNVTNTVASNSITDAVTDVAEDVKEIIEEAESTVTEETEVTDTKDEVTEPEEHVCKNAEPIAGDAVVDFSATYIDGTRYEIDNSIGWIYLNDEQMFDCDTLTVGTKETGGLCNISELLNESELDKSIYTLNDYGYYEYTAADTDYDLVYEEGVLKFISVSGPAACYINSKKLSLLEDITAEFGKPYILKYTSYGYTDKDYVLPDNGENYKLYTYVFRVGDFAITYSMEYMRSELDNIGIYDCRIFNLNAYDSIEDILHQ